jgi:long-chain acyl-CoA synthetase
MYEKKPWLKFYGDVPHSLDYPEKTMYQMVRKAAERYPHYTAYDFMGTRSSYEKFLSDIDLTADALLSQGLKQGDTVTICLPNCPQALILFYALNKIGAVASMIHPLSAPAEIEFYLKESNSVWAVTLDAFYKNFARILDNTKVTTLLLARIGDFLSPLKGFGFFVVSGRKIRKPPTHDKHVLWWNSLVSTPADKHIDTTPLKPDECAVILYSGGTTGTPKGIMLSSKNFNCLGMQIATQGPLEAGDVILSILPVFHGFGLGVCVHAFLIGGGKCVLVPRFTPETVAALIKKEKPQYMAGVPTLYESLVRNKIMRKTNLSCFKAAYAGGDKLPHSVKERFDELIKENGGKAELLEGYGLTESVTACIVTPKQQYREESVGIPLPDMQAKITKPGTDREVAPGTDGELCVSGPTLMLGYLNSPEVTAVTLKKHGDGRIWLHTGDICSMDSDGFISFKLRMKRIIKVSGVSVSPVQVEEVLDAHPDVSLCCVIGIPDPYKMQIVKAFVVLKEPAKDSAEKEKELIEYCRQHLIKWSVPKQIEFRDSLPLTLVGKVAFSELEKEHADTPDPSDIKKAGS